MGINALTVAISPDVHFEILDSGAPPHSNTYSTMLVLHGWAWNAHVFVKVLDLAPSRGVRVISVQRRGYGGTSPYTELELGPLRDPDQAAKHIDTFMFARSTEYALLIQKLAADFALAPGSVSLVGWSMGDMFVLDLLMRVPILAPALRDAVKTFVHTAVMYEAGMEGLGIPTPHPRSDVHYAYVFAELAAAQGQDFGEAAGNWVTGWFEYPALNELKNPNDVMERYILSNEKPPFRPSTLQKEGPDSLLARSCQLESGANDEFILKALQPVVTPNAVNQVLLADAAKHLNWPELRIEYVIGSNSMWSVHYGADQIRERFEGAVPGRKIHIVEGLNHVGFWEYPDRFLDAIIPFLSR
jgi:pimeloyl-ACP methyl ester carboxylesterase